MARGSHIVSVRFPDELLALIDQHIARSANTRPDGPLTRTSFIIKAVENQFKKMARSAKRKSPLPPTYKRDLFTF